MADVDRNVNTGIFGRKVSPSGRPPEVSQLDFQLYRCKGTRTYAIPKAAGNLIETRGYHVI